MPREVAIHGVYMPILTPLFVTAAALTWRLDRVFVSPGLYRFTWHPALFRVSLLICLYGDLLLITCR